MGRHAETHLLVEPLCPGMAVTGRAKLAHNQDLAGELRGSGITLLAVDPLGPAAAATPNAAAMTPENPATRAPSPVGADPGRHALRLRGRRTDRSGGHRPRLRGRVGPRPRSGRRAVRGPAEVRDPRNLGGRPHVAPTSAQTKRARWMAAWPAELPPPPTTTASWPVVSRAVLIAAPYRTPVLDRPASGLPLSAGSRRSPPMHEV